MFYNSSSGTSYIMNYLFMLMFRIRITSTNITIITNTQPPHRTTTSQNHTTILTRSIDYRTVGPNTIAILQ